MNLMSAEAEVVMLVLVVVVMLVAEAAAAEVMLAAEAVLARKNKGLLCPYSGLTSWQEISTL